MRHLIGIGALIIIAFALRFWLLASMAIDIPIRDHYRVIPINIVAYWLLIGFAAVWFLVVTYKFIRGNS